MAVTQFRPKPTSRTHVDIGRGILIPVREVNYLRSYFEELDLNGDGTIDPEEIKQKAREAYRLKKLRANGEIDDEDWVSIKNSLEAVGLLNPVLMNIAEMAPRVGQESLTWKALLMLAYPKASEDGFEGLLAIHEKTKKLDTLTANANELADLMSLWNMWDVDGSGELDPEEFRRALAMLNISSSEAESLYASIDDDANGFISLDEFARWWLTDNDEDRDNIDIREDSKNSLIKAKNKSMRAFFEDNWNFQLERLGLKTQVES